MTDEHAGGLRRQPPPGALQAVVRAGRRRRARAVAGAGAAVLLVATPLVALSVLPLSDDRVVVSGSPASSAPPSARPSPPPPEPCPASLGTSLGDLSVPAPPPDGADAALVPAVPPLAATVCRYGDAQIAGSGQSAAPPGAVALEGSVTLESGLEDVPSDLAVPAGTEIGPCTLVGGPVIPYLVQLQYEEGTVWLRTSSDVNACELVTNGAFTSPVYVGDQVAASYAAQAWVPAPRRWNAPEQGACPHPPTGRAGQEKALVPPGWDELVLCEGQGAAQSSRVVEEGQAREVAELLGSLPTEPAGGFTATCDDQQPVPGDDGDQLFLRFSYPQGRDVTVIPFFGCDPPLANGSLVAEATVTQQAELLRLLSE